MARFLVSSLLVIFVLWEAVASSQAQVVFFEDFESGLTQWPTPGSSVLSKRFAFSGANSQTFSRVNAGGDAFSRIFPVTPGQIYYLHVAYMTLGGGGYIGIDRFGASRNNLGETWLIGDGGFPSLSVFDFNVSNRNPANLGVWKVYTQRYTIPTNVFFIRIKTEDWSGGLPNNPVNAGVFFDDIEWSTNPTPFDSTLRIFPNKGGDTGSVSVRILGSGFKEGATVKLTRNGEVDIIGSPVTIREGGGTIYTTFDLTGKRRGLWNVVVINSDGSSFIISMGFTVEEGREAQVWVDIVGRNRIRVGREQTFYVFYGNRGNVDAIGIPLWIGGIPKNALLKLDFNISLPPQLPGIDISQIPIVVEAEGKVALPLLLPVIRPGAIGVFSFKLTTQTTQPFQLQAWASRSLVNSLSNVCNQLLDNAWLRCMKSALLLALDRIPAGAECADRAIEYLCRSLRLATTGDEGNVFSVIQLLTAGLIDCLRAVGVPDLREALNVISKAISFFETIGDCTNAFLGTFREIMDVFPVNSFDPNDKIGSLGVGNLGYHSGEEPLHYSVLFENLERATAPAQEVVIADQLDTAKVDLGTFSLGPITFGNKRAIPPPGASAFATDVDLRPSKNLIVRIRASLNRNTGILTWRFASLDPATGRLPDDPLAGFLPPNVNPPEGEGSVLFTVMPQKGLPTGTEIRNQAKIIFDANDPIVTPQWLNTIDNTKPTSNILSLAAVQNLATFDVRWSGTDTGSGILNYTVFVSENGGPFTAWLRNTAITSVPFTGQPGKTYSFYSLAQDQTGNVENAKTIAEANTIVSINARVAASVSAASYRGVVLATESIIAAYGSGLATTTLAAPGIPLPTSLGGTTVKVKDSAGIERFAPLFFISPLQVNYQIPPGTTTGIAAVTITSGGGTISTGTVQIAAVAPGLFAANANGQGVAAGVALRVRANGQQVFEPIVRFDQAQGRFVAVPIDLGPATDQVFLILFGTGVRFRNALASVTATIGGANAEVLFAGAQGGFVGLDQLNLRIPRTLAGRGEVDVTLTADGKTANVVKISIR